MGPPETQEEFARRDTDAYPPDLQRIAVGPWGGLPTRQGGWPVWPGFEGHQAISEANRFSVSVRLSSMIEMIESISSLVMTSGGPR